MNNITAGPYELINKKNNAEKIVFCIFNENEVSRKNYKGAKIVSSSTEYADDLEDAIAKLEGQMDSLKKEYSVKEAGNGPKDSGRPGPVLGKRASVPTASLGEPTKRIKKESSKEEEKKEETKGPELIRRSSRNEGKVANYNIDDILDAAEKEENGSTGGGCINVMLAETYKPELLPDPRGWYISEKLDGVRCYWNGSAMYTRNKNAFYPPDWFKKELPADMALDGELWSGRSDFQKIVSIVRRQDKNDEWKKIKFMVFDAPNLKKPFSKRLEAIEKKLAKLHKESPASADVVQLHEHRICEGYPQLMTELDEVCDAGGEGVMLREPNSLYENKRSTNLLKVKKFEDAEATVIGHE